MEVNNLEVPFKYDNKQIKIDPNAFINGTNTLNFSYHSTPKKALYFLGWENPAPNEKFGLKVKANTPLIGYPVFDDMNESHF